MMDDAKRVLLGFADGFAVRHSHRSAAARVPSPPLAENRLKRCAGAVAVCLWAVGCGSTLPLVETPPPGFDVWRGLEVVAEHRCSTYDADDYSYPQSLEDDIVAELGGVWSPYTLEVFESSRETDIEHMVARSEAHDSGGCAWGLERRREFSRDLLNVTLSEPTLNRQVKAGQDAAEWLPPENRCWFADRVIRVRQAWDLTIDRREADALDNLLAGCTSTTLQRP